MLWLLNVVLHLNHLDCLGSVYLGVFLRSASDPAEFLRASFPLLPLVEKEKSGININQDSQVLCWELELYYFKAFVSYLTTALSVHSNGEYKIILHGKIVVTGV